MDISKLLLTAGGAILNTVAPGAGTAATTLINAILPDDKKLDPDTVTGKQLSSAISTLSPDQQTAILNQQLQLDVQLSKERENTSDNFVQNQVSIHDLEKIGKSKSRAFIAVLMALTIVGICGGYIYGRLFIPNFSMTEIELFAIMSVPALLLKAHMGVESDSQAMTISTLQGKDFTPSVGLTKAMAMRIQPK